MIYQTYQQQLQETTVAIKKLDSAINKNSLARLAVILGGGALLFYSFQSDSIALVLGLTLLIVFLFAFLIRRQSKLERERSDKQQFLRINENEILLRDERKTIYDQGERFEDGKHPYVSDLDVFGQYSLFTLVNRCATALGVDKLASWLQSAASRSVIVERQLAAQEIAKDLNWSQDFQTKLLFNVGQKMEVKSFLSRYFADSSFAFGKTFMRLYVPIAPFLLLAGILVSIFVYPLWSYVSVLALIHLFWTMGLSGHVSQFSSKIDKVGQLLAAYADGIALVENKKFETALNIRLQKQLFQGERKVSIAFRELSALIDKLDARNNMLVGALLNMLFLWDFKQVMGIVRWKANYQDTILVAFDVIAEFEALNSLAVLQRNQPDWATPVLLENALQDQVDASALNHPLLAASHAVANDFTNQNHQIALITGSNMAGKSTFLRTFGVNAVLAYAGAVTCSKNFALPIYHLISYMRIKDSLNESTSTFKAELDRMKFILETVAADKESFFLIDEMLRGTNSVDKYLGSRAIIKTLIKEQAKGMVATHDLQLATLADEYPGKVENYHFDIQVIAGEMLFDYKLKHGQCTVFNASLLLKGIGIDVDKA